MTLLFITTNYLTNGYKTGAPPLSCKTMTPGHGATAQTSPVPYNISIVSTDATDGTIRARIFANPSSFFTGFLLTAKLLLSNSAGTFVAVPEDSAIINCGQDKVRGVI